MPLVRSVVNEAVQDPVQKVSGELAPVGLLSEKFGGNFLACYSMKDIGADGGPVVQVTNGSGSALNFTAAELVNTNLELTTHVGEGNDGYVSIWYDQSGNGRHATQTTTDNMPLIMDAGVYTQGIKSPHGTALADKRHMDVPFNGSQFTSNKIGMMVAGKDFNQGENSFGVLFGNTRGVQTYSGSTIAISVNGNTISLRNEHLTNAAQSAGNLVSLSHRTGITNVGFTLNGDTPYVFWDNNHEFDSDAPGDFGATPDFDSTINFKFFMSSLSNAADYWLRAADGTISEAYIFEGDTIDSIQQIISDINIKYSIN